MRLARVESLESRRLLAITVAGTAAADVIRIAADGANILIVVNGVESRYASDAEGIIVNAGNGNDTIRLEDASNLPVTIDGGANDDRIEIGAGNLRAARLFSVDVLGGSGTDSLIADDSLAATGNDLSVDNPIDTYVSLVAAPGSIIRADAGSTTTAVESITYNGTPFADTVYVHSTSALSTLFINGGNGDDSMTVGNDIDSRVKGPVTLDGQLGADVLTIDDSADSFADTYFLSATSTTVGTVRKNSGGATTTFTGFGNVSLIAGLAGAVPNNQVFRVDAFPTAISTTIFAGDGDDTLYFGDGVKNLDTFQSNLTFDAGDGPLDTVIYNDTVGTDPSAYGINPTSITNVGTATLNFLNTEQLSLTANGAANDIRVNATSATLFATINGGAGNDTIHVGNGDFDATVLNGVSILGGSGTDSLIIEDQSDDAGNDSYTFGAGSMNKGNAVMFWSTASADRVESISLVGSPNNDTIRVNNTTPAIAMRFDGGDGNDSFLIAATTDGTTAAVPVTIVSGAGNDSLDVNSDANGSDAIVALPTPGESFQDFRVRAGGRATITSGPLGVLSVRGLLTLGGKLDVADATMIVGNGDLNAIDTLTTAGYAGGLWTGGSAAAAIVSSVAAWGTGLNLALGVARAADIALPTFSGIATVAGDVVVRYTVGGDANLNRVVEFGDLALLSQNYGKTGQTWAQGDFNFDAAGAVTFGDLTVLAQNYGLGVTFLRPLPPPARRRHDLSSRGA